MSNPKGESEMSKKARTGKAAVGRKRRSEADLRRASMVVQYEVGTLDTMLSLLLDSNVSLRSPPEAQAVSNAILHTFLLAARNLIHFLYSHKPRPGDIVAEDFFDDPKVCCAARAKGAQDYRNGTLVGFISKHLAHLTWERASKTKPTWGAFPIAWGIAEALVEFVSAVEKTRVDVRLIDDVKQLMIELRQIRPAKPYLYIIIA